MYLNAKLYIGNSIDKYANVEFVDDSFDGMKLNYMEFEGAYWRKAKQIHKWFVENVQNDEDDCGNYYLDSGKLDELYNLCNKVIIGKQTLENNSVAMDLLPCQDGFYFEYDDETNYDEYYYEQIEETIEFIDKLKSNKYYNSFEFTYNSSW